jgi:cytochrome P450 family 135
VAGPGEPPGPGWPGTVAAARFAADPLGFLPGLAARYGDVFALRFPGFPPAVAVCAPEPAEQVFRDPETFRAGPANVLVFAPVDGEASVVCVDGGEHRGLRAALGPVSSWGRRHEGLIEAETSRAVGRWPRGRPIAVRPRVEPLTFDLLLRSALGVSTAQEPELAADVRRLAVRARPLYSAPFLRRNLGPLSPWQRLLAARRRLDRRLRPRLRAAAPDGTALAALQQAGVTDETVLRDQVVTLLMAGAESTATAVAWAFERLAAHPAAMERAAGDEAYLDAVVREALRLRPPFTMVWRMSAADAVLGGHAVPAGTLVVVAITALHLRPELFHEPHAFRPERHLGAGRPAGLIPFGGGARTCLGATTARLMTRAALGAALRAGRWSKPSPRPERPAVWGGTLVPLRGGRVVLGARRPA